MKVIGKYWFFVLFFVTLAIPIYWKVLDGSSTLSGVTDSINEMYATKETIGDGTYQTYLNSRWENEFPGRTFLMKLRNQFLYSALDESPNANVVIGKDKYLFEPGYIYLEVQAEAPQSTEYFDELGNKLNTLKTILYGNNKELYVFITPSKARYYREYIPDRYMFLDRENEYSYTNYSKLIETLNANSILYFDSIEYIDTNKDNMIFQAPVFPKTGDHWTHSWGEGAAVEFVNYVNKHSRFNLGKLSVNEYSSKAPVAPDTDLYSSLNLALAAEDSWYGANVVVDSESDKPNVFIRGGSFTFQSLNLLINAGIFGEDVHISNQVCFMNNYSEQIRMSGYSGYTEVDIDSLVGKSDIIVLEVNEAAIKNMSFRFIDYLIEHPEYLDEDY